jgi:hypothetical protein
MIPILHVVNPDSVIVRVNLARATEGKTFDARYNAALSADSVPEMVHALARLSQEDRRIVREAQINWYRRQRGDWREWSYSRGRAIAILGDKAMTEYDIDPEPTVALPIPQPSTIINIPYTPPEDIQTMPLLRQGDVPAK